MTKTFRPKILIVGAGISGLTLALCLKKNDLSCEIIEKRKAISPEGAGIQITPNAYHVFDSLGLGETINKHAYRPQALNIIDGLDGKKITTMPLGVSFKKNYKAPYLVLSRPKLIEILFEATKALKIPIRFDCPYSDNQSIKTDVIIGADGVWSNVRQENFNQTAEFTGRVAYRALIKSTEREEVKNKLSIFLGDNAHIVSYPISENNENVESLFNLVCIVRQKSSHHHWSSPASAADILPHLENWHSPLKDLIKQTKEWSKWPLFHRMPTAPWHHDNVVLLGDAAHAMVPFLAQGAAMAVEDAAVLAHAFSKSDDRQHVFSHYEAIRKPRVTKVWQEAWRNGERYHWQGIKAKTRNLGLRVLGGQHLLNRYNWIYQWRLDK